MPICLLLSLSYLQAHSHKKKIQFDLSQGICLSFPLQSCLTASGRGIQFLGQRLERGKRLHDTAYGICFVIGLLTWTGKSVQAVSSLCRPCGGTSAKPQSLTASGVSVLAALPRDYIRGGPSHTNSTKHEDRYAERKHLSQPDLQHCSRFKDGNGHSGIFGNHRQNC